MSDETQALLLFLAGWACLAAGTAYVLARLVQGAGEDPDEPRPGQVTVDLHVETIDDELARLLSEAPRRGVS